MKKIILLSAVLFTSFVAILAQDDTIIKGIWINADKDARIEIYRTGNVYYGKIIWTNNMYEADGKTLKKDTKNPDEKLRNRSISNLVILSGFTYADGEWAGGQIYDPKSGKTYKSKMWIKGNSLQIRGYLGFFGKTTEWIRA